MEPIATPLKPMTGGVDVGAGFLASTNATGKFSSLGLFSVHGGPQWKLGGEFGKLSTQVFIQHAVSQAPLRLEWGSGSFRGLWSGGVKIENKFSIGSGRELLGAGFAALEIGSNLIPGRGVNGLFTSLGIGVCGSNKNLCLAWKGYLYAFNREVDFVKSPAGSPDAKALGYGPNPNNLLFGAGLVFSANLD